MVKQRLGMPVLAALLATIQGGCTVGPDYVRPSLSAPVRWLGLGGTPRLRASEAEVGNLAWWRSFDDPVLDRLIDLALTNNGDLKIALARLNQARANRLSAQAALLPDFGVTASTSRVDTAGQLSRASAVGFDASWEVDLFGGLRRSAEAARADVAAADAARRQVRVSLLAEVARNYLDVRQLQQQVLLTDRNLKIQEETLRIVRAQFREGVASGLDITRTEGQVASTRAQVPQVAQNLAIALNNLAVLTGQQPAQLRETTTPAQKIPVATPKVVVATPARVLARRPDVQQAERNLAAATANQGVALSNWFPRVTLTSLFGLRSADGQLRNSVRTNTIGGSISMPLLDFGQVRAIVKRADAQQQEALANYEQVVLAALADVESSLSGYVNAQTRLQDLKAAADANRAAVDLAQARLREGVVPLLDVLTAQQQQYAAESTLASGEAAVGQALAALYKALGGAADDPAPPAPKASSVFAR